MNECNPIEGYTFVAGQETNGMYGVKIFVKGPPSFIAALNSKDDRGLSRVRFHSDLEDILESIHVVEVTLDPETKSKQVECRARFAQLFIRAGLNPVYMEQLPNGYCSKHCCIHEPWWRVTSEIGHVTIGWRKSVINIDWTASMIQQSGRDLFPEEDVTRLDRGIHAWGYGKAVEYLRRLSQAAA